MNPIKYYEFEHNKESYVVPINWLTDHDKQIIDKFVKHCENGIPYDICDGNEAMEFIREIAEHMKGEQNEGD